MNGFAGVFHTYKLDNGGARARAMLDRIAHRGPDFRGLTADDRCAIAWCGIGQAADVPSVDGITVIVDGKINNLDVLQRELVNAGLKTEKNEAAVLPLAFKQFGTALFRKLTGHFALAIRDQKENNLYLVRDGFGVKPLYYTKNTTDGSWLFASEIKAFMADPFFQKAFNPDPLRSYLSFEYSVLEESFFQGVYHVHAGEFACIRDGEVSTERFFQIPLGVKKQTMKQAVTRIRQTLEGKKPASMDGIGGYLSGGVDSSYLTALYRPAATFSVGFPGEAANFNETDLARSLSEHLGIPNYTRLIEPDEIFRTLPRICYHFDEPQSNLSSLALWFLAENTKKYVSAVISGEGADELFGGYHWYNKSHWQLAVEAVLPKRIRYWLAKKAKSWPDNRMKHLLVKSGPVENNFIGHAYTFSADEAADVLQPEFLSGPSPTDVTAPIFKEVEGYDDLTKMRYLDFKLWSPELIMHKADRMCMAHAVDIFMPYVDRDVLAIGMSLPRHLLVKPSMTKRAFRKAAASLLPETDRTKLGFEVPVAEWLRREPFMSQVRQMLNESLAARFFRTDQLNRLFDEHVINKARNGRKLWTVYSFLVWYKQYFPEKTN